MTVAVVLLAVWVFVLSRRIRHLEREQLATLLQVTAMFENAKACDDALAGMIQERDVDSITLSMN